MDGQSLAWKQLFKAGRCRVRPRGHARRRHGPAAPSARCRGQPRAAAAGVLQLPGTGRREPGRQALPAGGPPGPAPPALNSAPGELGAQSPGSAP